MKLGNYIIGDRIILKKETLIGLHLSKSKEYIIIGSSTTNDYCYNIINNIGEIVTIHEVYFNISPTYQRNKTIEDILS